MGAPRDERAMLIREALGKATDAAGTDLEIEVRRARHRGPTAADQLVGVVVQARPSTMLVSHESSGTGTSSAMTLASAPDSVKRPSRHQLRPRSSSRLR